MMDKSVSFSPDLTEMLNDAGIDLVTALDMQQRIVAWNKALEKMSGLTKPVVIGKSLTEVFPVICSDVQMLTAIKNAYTGFKTFIPADAAFSHRSFYETHLIPLRNSLGEVRGIMLILHDVSHRIKAEQHLAALNVRLHAKNIQLEKKMSELAMFTLIASQDVKAPLMSVYLNLEKIIRTEGAQLSNSSKASFRKMQISLNRMRLLLEDIVKISGLDDAVQEKQQCNLNEIVSRVKDMLLKKSEEKAAAIIAHDLPAVYGYPELLSQLFYQLMDNAIKFQSDAAKPSVTIEYQMNVRMVVPDSSPPGEKNFLKLSFIDNGIGFDTAQVDTIFTLFGQLHPGKYHGSGTGLAICKKIVELHEGFISVNATPASGSCFNIFLPIEE